MGNRLIGSWAGAFGLLLAVWAGATQPAAAQSSATPPALIPVERFFQQPSLVSARLSPSGRYLAATTARGGSRLALVVIDLEAGLRPYRAAAFADLDVTGFEWVGDERLVFGLTDLRSGSGEDQRVGAGLFSVRFDGSDGRVLIQREGFQTREGSRDRSLDPNHVLLQVPAPGGEATANEVIIGRLRAGGGVTPLLLDIVTGRTRSMDLVGSPDDVRRWYFDSKGRPVGVTTTRDDRVSHHLRSADGKTWTTIHSSPVMELALNIVRIADDGKVYVTHPEGPRGYAVLSEFDTGAGRVAAEPLLRTPGFDFAGQLLAQDGKVIGVRYNTDAEGTAWFDPALKGFQEQVDKRFAGRINTVSCRRCGKPDMRALVFSYSDQDPGRYWLFDAKDQRWQSVGPVMDGIEPNRMAQVDFHRFTARDGREIPVWVTRPAGLKAGQAAPAVVMVHGGPWVRGGSWRWDAWEQFLASRGYVVISPEFRGSEGYGRDHFRAGWKQWGQSMQDDVADALLWAQKRGLASDKACIAGASYGGYATLMGLVRHPELYRCGAAWVAVTDLMLLVKGSPWVLDDTSPEARRLGIPRMVGDATQDAEMLRANSPVEQAERIRAPLLLGFGEEDIRVPLAHGRRMRDALVRHGRAPEWVTYAGEGHSWRQVKTNVDFAVRLERFFAQHLGGNVSR